jgi:hypothetical protein
MSGGDEKLLAFLESFGFSEDELKIVIDELNAYRSVPGTTLGRYMNRIVNNLAEEDRNAFLKGLMVGIAIRKIADDLEESDFIEEEKRIQCEIEKLGFGEG